VFSAFFGHVFCLLSFSVAQGLNKAKFLNFLSFWRGLRNLQHLGRVLHISPSRNLILKAELLPKIGDKVVDENLKSVGSVFDVFGPVSSPYVAVKPVIIDLKHLIKSRLYAIPSTARRKEKKKHAR